MHRLLVCGVTCAYSESLAGGAKGHAQARQKQRRLGKACDHRVERWHLGHHAACVLVLYWPCGLGGNNDGQRVVVMPPRHPFGSGSSSSLQHPSRACDTRPNAAPLSSRQRSVTGMISICCIFLFRTVVSAGSCRRPVLCACVRGSTNV